ncbi:PIN domain-containing protein [Candidatus Woesearchaeota archaeon]|nr:PIN domain-containing protein [Candidatus Woesearchaeota archaeon]
MRFLDANIIAYAFYENEHTSRCQQVIARGGVINTVVLIESYNIIEHLTDTTYATRMIKMLLKSHLKIIPVDIDLVFETIKRSEKYRKLHFIDRLHFVTALLHNCEAIMSFDKDFNGLEIPRETE